MLAEFYIVPDSFAFNSTFSRNEIESKIKSLAIDFTYIRKYKDTNRLLVHHEIYNVIFFNNKTLGQLLFNEDGSKQLIDRDVYNALQKVIVESASTAITVAEVIDVLLSEHNENICHGLIAFNQIDGINSDFQVVYNFRGWLDFRRHFLALYPGTNAFFISECKKYFPNLFFHERNAMTVGQILAECPKKIIYHLAALNDNFRNSQTEGQNRTQVLNHFSISAHLDETATLEGNPEKKPDLTFEFSNTVGQLEKVCCEPHLKLPYNDNHPGDMSYSNNRRIYFHEGKSNIMSGRILIGHIGNHL